MSYSLYRELINLTEEFEHEFKEGSRTVKAFSDWLTKKVVNRNYEENEEVDWEGQKEGRSAESVINTSFLHLYRYAKLYSKLAISESPFSTIDDVIFLINLQHLGSMSKKALIDLNVHEKSTGIQIINRLLFAGFIEEAINPKDRRSKHVMITQKGQTALDANMEKIRAASRMVVGDLTNQEKLQLIKLLQKLELFHQSKAKEATNGAIF